MKKANLIFVNILLIISSLTIGYFIGKKGYEVELKTKEVSLNITNKRPDFNVESDFSIFWKAYEDLNNKHLEKPLNGEELVQGAIRGMVRSVGDPYTLYLEPQSNTSSDEVLKGEYEGIGAELIMRDEVVTVVSPFDESPAKKAGIRPNDKILAVDGENIFGETLQDVVQKIKGPKGTEVMLTISRESSEEPFDVTLIRDQIKLETVALKTMEELELEEANAVGDRAVYVRISRFGEKTNSEWDEAVSNILVQHPNANTVVLDLRGNPGGFLGSAVHLASDFISRGTVVKEEFSDGTVRNIPVDHKAKLLDKDLIVLVDEGSASASEILAGALREKANAQVVGVTTFGKGTVQEPIDYADGSGINITIGKWLTPEGYWVHEQGLEPDVVVELSEEDIENQNDLQLKEALELAVGS